MDLKPSPLAPEKFPDMPAIDGVDMWVGEAGFKYKNRPDIWLARVAAGSRVAGVFTTSQTPGAPVAWSKQALAHHGDSQDMSQTSAILVNSGNANVYTGDTGVQTVFQSAALVNEITDVPAANVFISSTGVIGEPLDVGLIEKVLKSKSFLNDQATWKQAAQAIATTDTYIKGAHIQTEINGVAINLCGIAKGSGMIAPNMATMLGYIFTDANIAQPILQFLLSQCNEISFNAITVDSDTSTSDTVILAATAKADHIEITDIDDPALTQFKRALTSLMINLAHQIVKDGEGAQKFIEINVLGAVDDQSAKNVAMSIANSPLVKTAIAGEDANWGRVVMAIGKSGEDIDMGALEIAFGPHIVAENGARSAKYNEVQVSDYIREKSINVHVNLNLGPGKFTTWTCDLTHGYIDINADYRT